MRFKFNPEGDFERDLIDRCIDGHYVVDITMKPHSDEPPVEHKAVRILVRRNGLLSIVLNTGVELTPDEIDTVMIW